MKFPIYLATLALISVLGWQVSCDDDNNEMFDFKFGHYFKDDFYDWLHNTTSWADLENGLDAHLPKHMTGTLCRNTTEGIKAEIPKCKSEFKFKNYVAKLQNSPRFLLYIGDEDLFDDPDFKTWIRTVKTWEDFENGFVSNVPKHANLSSVVESFCRYAGYSVIGAIRDLMLLDFVSSPENWNMETGAYDSCKGLGHQKIPDVIEESLPGKKDRRQRRGIILEALSRITRSQQQKL